MAKLRDYTWYDFAERYYYPYYRGTYTDHITTDDDALRATVEAVLTDDAWVDDSRIDVDVKDAQVTLKGTVNSFFEKRVAGDDAADVRGVKNVNNNLTVSGL